MIDFIHKWSGNRSGLSQLQIVGWVGIARSKFYDWQTRYGKANEHNSWIPRDHWLDGWGLIRNFVCGSGLIFLNQRADSEKNLDPNWMANCVTADRHVRGGFFHLRTMFCKAR